MSTTPKITKPSPEQLSPRQILATMAYHFKRMANVLGATKLDESASSTLSEFGIVRALDEREQITILILHRRLQWQRRSQRHDWLRRLRYYRCRAE